MRARPAPLAVAAAMAWSCGPSGPTVAVAGTVVQADGSSPQSLTVQVRTGAYRATVTPDATGRFQLSGVPVPYDAVVFDGKCVATVYQGLRRSDPTLTNSALHPGSSRSAVISGRVTGLPSPTPSHVYDLLWTGFVSTRGTSGVVLIVGLDQPTFQLTVNWNGPERITGDLHLLAGVQGAGSQTSFDGYGVLRDLSLTNGGRVTVPDLALEPAPSSTLSGSVTLPSGYYDGSVFESTLARPGAAAGFAFNVADQTASFSFPIPMLSGLAIQVQLVAQASNGARGLVRQEWQPGGQNPRLSLPPPVELLSPAAGASVSPRSALFSWSPMQGAGLYQVAIGNGGCGEIEIYTSETSFLLPDFSSVGFSWTPQISWNVSTQSSPTTVDALAGAVSPLAVLQQENLAVTSSPARALTLLLQ